MLPVWCFFSFDCVFLAQKSIHSVTVPLQLYTVRKCIVVLKSCFAMLSSLSENQPTKKQQQQKLEREIGFREVREAQQFSQEHQK